ncbi:MAG: MSMEG_1061 family FMN-dependent PPOX-type flavoprotein [Pseudonocardia sp.]
MPEPGPGAAAASTVIRTAEELAALYPAPHPLVAGKKMAALDPGVQAVIGMSPLVMLATTGRDGVPTVSPRGGHPGFVRVLDAHRLALPDLPGNRLIDSMRHLVENPHAGLLFLVPGHETLLRVEGRAEIVTDPELTAGLAGPDGRVPAAAVVVTVETLFLHCGASLRRSGVWDPASWGTDADALDAAERAHWAHVKAVRTGEAVSPPGPGTAPRS